MNGTPRRDTYDVVVIGAGPAGLAAATTTAEAGLSTLLLDENAVERWRHVSSTVGEIATSQEVLEQIKQTK